MCIYVMSRQYRKISFQHEDWHKGHTFLSAENIYGIPNGNIDFEIVEIAEL